jgi:uncharacterized protein (UPF0335 family)
MTDETNFENQPDEINDMKALVKEFITRSRNIENEIELLKQDQKDLIEEYAEKLDVKTLKLALKAVKLEASVAHRDTFDIMVEALKDPA